MCASSSLWPKASGSISCIDALRQEATQQSQIRVEVSSILRTVQDRNRTSPAAPTFQHLQNKWTSISALHASLLWREKIQDTYRGGSNTHLLISWRSCQKCQKEEDAARWKEKPTVALFASAPTL
jgi:hypothetical protein